MEILMMTGNLNGQMKISHKCFNMRQNPYTSPPVLKIDKPHETKGG